MATKTTHMQWTPEDNAKLIQSWGTASEEALLAMFPGRDIPNMTRQATKLREHGLPVPKRHVNAVKNQWKNRWTDKETNILLQNYQSMPREELLALLPGRNWGQCTNRIRRLKINGVNTPIRIAGQEPEQTCAPAPYKSDQDNYGISYDSHKDMWAARIRFDNKTYFIIKVKDKTAAIAARKRVSAALEEICNALRNASRNPNITQACEQRDALLAKGCQIIETEIRQIRAERDKAKQTSSRKETASCRVNETRISPQFAATGAGLRTRTPGSSNAGP